MHKRIGTLLWIVLIVFCGFSVFFHPEAVVSQTERSYYPATYVPVNSTRYVSGNINDLQSNDSVCMVFQGYPSLASQKSMYAHQETIRVAGTEYYVSSLDTADSAGINLSVPLSSAGRTLLGKFVYPLTGMTSIPSSTWTINYLAWLSNVSEIVSLNSPSHTPNVLWANADRAYSSDNTYANSSNPGTAQRYGSYGFNLPPTASITKVEVGYEAYTVGDEGISVALSWNGGLQWTATYDSSSLGTSDPNMVSWVDFTTVTNWTASMLSDINFQSRVVVVKVGLSTDTVFLDWLPVRVTYVGGSSSAHMDVSILVRRSDGVVRQTLAVNVANTESLSPTVQTLTGTYDWSYYAVANETDYLEIDYYVDILVDVISAGSEVIANLRIDDVALVVVDQTRVANMMLPSEYTVEVEFSGYSDVSNWSEIVWTMDASWTTDNVFTTLQLYDYSQTNYPAFGNGHIALLSSSAPNTDELMTQTITTNTTNFRDYLGNWKMKIKGAKATASPFGLRLDLSMYEATPIVHHDVAVLSVTYSQTSIYLGDMVEVNATVKNEGETSEIFNVTSYNDDNQIGKQTITNLQPNESRLLTFQWNTTGMIAGSYVLKAVADTVPDEDDTANNVFIYGLVRIKGQPVAFFTHTPESFSVGETVTFNASLSTSDGDLITSCNWDFGDGNTQVTNSFIITHAYANAGNYTVVLNVTNNDGLWDIASETISIESLSVAASSPWNLMWALPFVPLLILLFAGIGWKKRKDQPKFVGIECLNEITGGGIPDSYSVMLAGSSDSGKSILFQELVHEFLKMEKPCVYISYEGFPDEIRENMNKFQWNTSDYESQGKLSFIDCFSSSAKVQSKEKLYLTQPFSLVDLGIIISKATNNAGSNVKVFLDSLVPIITQIDPERVVDFLQDRIARVKGAQGNLIFTLNKESVDPVLMSRLEEIVDCVIEFDASQINGRIARKLRIKKMRGRSFSDKWVRFEMNPTKGIVFPV